MDITSNKRINQIYPLLNKHITRNKRINIYPLLNNAITRNKRINKIYPLLNNAHYAQ